jgi:hypothetical protein
MPRECSGGCGAPRASTRRITCLRSAARRRCGSSTAPARAAACSSCRVRQRILWLFACGRGTVVMRPPRLSACAGVSVVSPGPAPGGRPTGHDAVQLAASAVAAQAGVHRAGRAFVHPWAFRCQTSVIPIAWQRVHLGRTLLPLAQGTASPPHSAAHQPSRVTKQTTSGFWSRRCARARRGCCWACCRATMRT